MEINKFIVQTSIVYGSLYIFCITLKQINKIILNRKSTDNIPIDFIMFNGPILLFSDITFAYNAAKILNRID
jgi:hypothetical protein